MSDGFKAVLIGDLVNKYLEIVGVNRQYRQAFGADQVMVVPGKLVA
jgi:hypothetical protein